MTPADPVLLRRYAETRAEDAFAELVRRHLAFVHATALRRVGGDTHRAEEIAQIVFTDLARKAATVSRHPALTAWLHTATRFAAIDFVRREQRRKTREHLAHAMSPDSPYHPPEPAADWDRLRPVIDASLDQLAPPDRTAILLRFFESRSFAAIGEKLHLTEEAARKRTDRALEKLRTLLSRHGLTSTTAALSLALASHVSAAAPATLVATITAKSLATASAGSSGLLSFLTMTKLQTAAALLIAAAATGGPVALGVALSRQNSVLHATLANTRTQSTANAGRIRELEENLATTRRAHGALLAKLHSAATSLTAPHQPSRMGKSASEQVSRLLESYLDNPAYLALQRSMLHRQMAGQFADFFDRQHFDPARSEQFKTLLVEQGMSAIELHLAAQKAGLSLEDEPFASEGRKLSARLREDVSQLLGPEGLDAYVDYLRVTRVHTQIATEIGLDLADAGQPIPPDQQKILARILCEEDQRPRPVGIGPEAQPSTDGLDDEERAVLARLAEKFSPEQTRLVRAYFVDTRKAGDLYDQILAGIPNEDVQP